ncbi:esterase FE4-like [Schistocerca cancellata]|uniref:esterase FE4-like n=1 Tax=Schistocerca cancellata TaxID=274614 RepID=UPI0021199DAC|nr:esterase FE4-like [Schistocerca cancellata]
MDFRALVLSAITVHLCLVPSSVYAQEYVTVNIQEGTLRGELSQTYTGNPIYRFQGIPYAEPPVGDLRFQPPITKAAWSGERDALKASSQCPQFRSNALSGNEDCLYLNVYGPGTPAPTDSPKSVIVWFHGGCFTRGIGSSVTPDYFVDNDIIFVGTNYRLGVLGFISTGDEVVPGNMGLKDQAEALRWVQRNIAAFGGDPNRVTLLGQSAGSASVHYHVLSPMSAGLFKNAIGMSGTALSPWAFSKNATDRTIRFAKYLGYTGSTSAELLAFMKTIDWTRLVVDANIALSEEDSTSLFTCVWVPSAEPQHDGAFLTEQPATLVAEGRYNLVPYMAGVTDLELLSQTHSGGILSTEEQINNLNQNFDEIVACDIRLPTRQEQLNGAHSVKQFYYNGSDITVQDSYTTTLMTSHLYFTEGVDTVIRSMSRFSSQPVFQYEFTFVGPLNAYPSGPGAAHADDASYLFFSSDLDPTSDGAIIRDQMTAMWANFAKYDNPTPEQTSLLTETWNEYDESSKNFLEITAPLKGRTNLFGPYMDFWHSLLPQK